MISFVTLDLDNTLWDADRPIERAHEAMCAFIVDQYPDAQPLIDDLEKWRAGRHQVASKRPGIRHHPGEMRKAVTRHLLTPLALPENQFELLVGQAFEVFHEGRNQVVPYPEAIDMLLQLQTRLPVVAITNGNACLERIGLAHLFTGIVSAESAGVAKPAPGIFHAALKIAGFPAYEGVHVGDHPEEDIAAARALGFHTVWVRRGGVSDAVICDRIADSPADMRDILCDLTKQKRAP